MKKYSLNLQVLVLQRVGLVVDIWIDILENTMKSFLLCSDKFFYLFYDVEALSKTLL